ncbi:MAG: diguanylate cyclase [Longicatena sp.]
MKVKKATLVIIFIIGIVSATFLTMRDFSFQLKNSLTKETYRTLVDASLHYNEVFSDRIHYNQKTLEVLAGSLESKNTWTKEEVIGILKKAVLDGGFEKIVVSDKEGNSFSNTGKTANISQRDYFIKGLAGESTISGPITSLVEDEKVIVISVPLKQNQENTGVLFGVYPTATAGKELLDTSYRSHEYGFIVANDGSLLITNGHEDKLIKEDNMFHFLSQTQLQDISINEIKQIMQKGEQKSFTYKYKGNTRFVSVMPSKINDWYTFSVASDKLMVQQEADTNRIVVSMIGKLIIIAFFIGVYFAIHMKRHNQMITKANQRYQSLLDNINAGLVIASHAKNSEDLMVSYVSDEFTKMTGYTLDDIAMIYGGHYFQLMHEEDREEAFSMYLTQIEKGSNYHVSYRIKKKDGNYIWVMDNGYLVGEKDKLNNHSIISDITAMKKQEQELRLSENRFSIAINASSGTLFEIDLTHKTYTHFENAERMFGVGSDKLLEATNVFASLPYEEYVKAISTYFFHEDDYKLVNIKMEELRLQCKVSFEARLRRFDNVYIWAHIDLSMMIDKYHRPLRLIGYMSDIDDIKKKTEVLEKRLQKDAMTGLFNKVAMESLVNDILESDADKLHALIVIDIDNFKGINDTLGHAFGDVVLIDVAEKLKTLFRSDDIIARMGGDEFAIVMRNVPDTSMVLKKATELSNAFRQTYTGDKAEYKISCSMGILMIETDDEPFEVLYRKSDAALYQSKESGKDQFVLYQENNAKNYPISNNKTREEELQNIKSEHNIEEYIFELLYATKDFQVSINMALAAIGQYFHVSRVSIFENDDEMKKTTNIFEWCNTEIPSFIKQLQDIDLSFGEQYIMDSFDSKGLLYCNNVDDLPSYIRNLFKSQGIMSTLQVTIVNDDRTYGFIGFDECGENRIWTSEEIDKLSYLAKIVSVFLFKKKTEANLIENLHTRLKILDVLPDYICVVNPETHTIEYSNNVMQELFPSVKPGQYCFTNLRGGQEAPCESCIIEKIRQGDVDNLEIISEQGQKRLKVRALTINWSNERKMVLLYGKIREE